MAVTIKDIAAATGLSLATISKYNNGGNVRPENRKLIEEAITRLDYQVNESARALKTSHSNTVGVIIPDLNDLFAISIVTYIEDVLRQQKYAAIICDSRNNPTLEADIVRMLIRKQVDGIINMPVHSDGAHLRPALDRNLPVVIVDRVIHPLRQQVSTVAVDNLEASQNAIHRLIWYGHRQIGIIIGPPQIMTSQERLQGYRQALLNAGITPDHSLVAYGDYSMNSGYECAKMLLEKNREMTALFVTNYEMSLGAWTALNEMNIRLPGDLSFIGFDDLRLSRLIRPRLTMVAQPIEEIGKTAARMMLERISTGNRLPAENSILLSASLLDGESTGVPGR